MYIQAVSIALYYGMLPATIYVYCQSIEKEMQPLHTSGPNMFRSTLSTRGTPYSKPTHLLQVDDHSTTSKAHKTRRRVEGSILLRVSKVSTFGSRGKVLVPDNVTVK